MNVVVFSYTAFYIMFMYQNLLLSSGVEVHTLIKCVIIIKYSKSNHIYQLYLWSFVRKGKICKNVYKNCAIKSNTNATIPGIVTET